jgi:hypothetical protein
MEERGLFEDLDVPERAILKWILEAQGEELWTDSFDLESKLDLGSCEHVY